MVINMTISDQAIRAKLLRLFDLGEELGFYEERNKPACFQDIRENNKHLFDERAIILEEVVNLINHRD